MYCPRCAVQLVDGHKFCRACGADLKAVALALADPQLPSKGGKNKTRAPKKEKTWTEQVEKRLDEYLEGLFWITVFGLGVILGGAVLLTTVLKFPRGLIIAYLILSSAAFLINFGLNLREALRLARSLKQSDGEAMASSRDTNELPPAEGDTPSEFAHSVTENTTRSLEPIPK
ncbi:MAG: zinc-ribbon domain-containing protein [Blastocatellia bacterium]